MAYSVSIEQTSKELTAKERVQIKDTGDCVHIDAATQESDNGSIVINPAWYAILSIHNDKSQDKDYENYVIVDRDGTRYVTGSHSFMDAFLNIFEEMETVTDEEWALKVYRLPSKNRAGKDFITCSVI